MENKESIIEALKKVNYPGFSKDIVSLDAVENVQVSEGLITVTMRPISADQAALDMLRANIESEIAKVDGSSAIQVNLNEGHAGGESSHGEQDSPFVRNKLPGVGAVIPVISGKGGVGKSTVAVNLAYTMSRLGAKVGILDLDIFGPSVHKMLGINEKLQTAGAHIIPVEAHGMKIVSVGMTVEDDQALILRGPMVMKLLEQLINSVDWGELDYLIVDMPPGTGDVPLSLVQKIEVAGAVVVTTPQDISLIDVRRAVDMFKKTDTRMIGLVENMSHYVCENCGDVAHIFGKDGGALEAEKLGMPLLGKIPLVKSICEEAESGKPIFDRDKHPELAKVFEDIAKQVETATASSEKETA